MVNATICPEDKTNADPADVYKRQLHIKPVDDLMKQFGMSDQDLDNMENRMESMMEEMGDANPLSMMTVSYTHLDVYKRQDHA